MPDVDQGFECFIPLVCTDLDAWEGLQVRWQAPVEQILAGSDPAEACVCYVASDDVQGFEGCCPQRVSACHQGGLAEARCQQCVVVRAFDGLDLKFSQLSHARVPRPRNSLRVVDVRCHCRLLVVRCPRYSQVVAMAKPLTTTEMQSIKNLPEPELIERLKSLKAEQLRLLCAHVGTGVCGKKEDMQTRIHEVIVGNRQESEAAGVAQSPENREGRRRSPKLGKAATAMRAAVASDEIAAGQAAARDKVTFVAGETVGGGIGNHESDLMDDSFADDVPQKTGTSASAATAPMSWPAPPPAVPSLPAFGAQKEALKMFIGTPAPCHRAAAGTPLAEVRARAAAVRASLEDSLPKPPAVNVELEGRERDLAEEAARDFEPSNRDILNAIKAMRENMIVRDDVRADIAEAMQPVHERLDQVEIKSSQALDETKALHERLVTQEKASVMEFDRVGRLETSMQALRVTGPAGSSTSKTGKPDNSHLQVCFKGFTTDTLDGRVATIKQFMEKHFKNEKEYIACYDTRMKGPFDNRQPTDESFVQFLTPAARDRVLKRAKDGQLAKDLKSSKGASLKVDRMPSDHVRSRNFAMRSVRGADQEEAL